MKLHFQASPVETAQRALRELTKRYGQIERPTDTDVIVSLGGDGQTLKALQDGIRFKKPVFGLNFGHAGFFQNLYVQDEDLIQRIKTAEPNSLSPLRARAEFLDGSVRQSFAINEIHVCNHNRGEVIYLRFSLDGVERVPRLGADGLIISTTIGSTGYNKSARGPISALGDDLLLFTPNNAFTPDRMRANVIRPRPIVIDVLDAKFRMADIYADAALVGEGGTKIHIDLDTKHPYELLFDPGYGLHERIMRTQFPTSASGE
jgi:NAD+ kinase